MTAERIDGEDLAVVRSIAAERISRCREEHAFFVSAHHRRKVADVDPVEVRELKHLLPEGDKELTWSVDAEHWILRCPVDEQAASGWPATRQRELGDHLPVRSDDGRQLTEPAPVDRDRNRSPAAGRARSRRSRRRRSRWWIWRRSRRRTRG